MWDLCVYRYTKRVNTVASQVNGWGLMFVKFWFRLTEQKDGLLYKAYVENQKIGSNWWKSVCNLLRIAKVDVRS